MSIPMSDISKVLGLPQPTKKPSTLKKLRDPPAPRYIDKQRAIAIARQLKLGKIGKVTLRVSDKSGLSDIHKTEETSHKVLSRRVIIDQTKGLQTATITKDSAVGKCILGPNKYHNRRLANKMDKIVEDEEKRRSLLNRKTREFKHHQVRKTISDAHNVTKSKDFKQNSPHDIILPGINTSDDSTNGRRSKSPGYMRPRSCSGTRYTDASVAEAEQFLNSNVIRATLDVPDDRSSSRAIDLVEASNTEYRPKSASQLAADADDSEQNGKVDDRSNTGDPIPSSSPPTKHSRKPYINTPVNAFASAGITLLQNKYNQEAQDIRRTTSTDDETHRLHQPLTDGQREELSEPKDKAVPNMRRTVEHVDQKDKSQSSDTEYDAKSSQKISQLQDTPVTADGSASSKANIIETKTEMNIEDINNISNSDTDATPKLSSGPSNNKLRLSKLKHPLGRVAKKNKSSFMETILDESPRSTPTGKNSPNLQNVVTKSILNRMTPLTPVATDKDDDNTDNIVDGATTSRSSMNMRRAATIAAQMIELKNTARKRRRRKNVAFSKSVRDVPNHSQPGYKVTADPRFLNLQSSLIPDSAKSRHLYDAMSNVAIADKPMNKQEGKGLKNAILYSRKSENLAKFEEVFGK